LYAIWGASFDVIGNLPGYSCNVFRLIAETC
jgi:hypothetical protein